MNVVIISIKDFIAFSVSITCEQVFLPTCHYSKSQCIFEWTVCGRVCHVNILTHGISGRSSSIYFRLQFNPSTDVTLNFGEYQTHSVFGIQIMGGSENTISIDSNKCSFNAERQVINLPQEKMRFYQKIHLVNFMFFREFRIV